MAQAPSPPRRVGEALSGATSLPRNLCARVVARVAIARSPQSDPSPVLPRACPRVPTPATATRARRPADADPSPSPPHAGLTIEDTSGETSARLRARFAAAHGLDGVRFRPFGEALLDAEDRARDASRAAPRSRAPRRRRMAGRRPRRGRRRGTPPRSSQVQQVLHPGRPRRERRRRRRRERRRTSTSWTRFPRAPIRSTRPPARHPAKERDPCRPATRAARAARVACSSPGARLDAVDHDEELYADARAWCGPPAASFARASPRPNPSDRHSGVVFPNETPPRIGTWTDRGSTGLDSCPTTRPTSPYCVSDTRRR